MYYTTNRIETSSCFAQFFLSFSQAAAFSTIAVSSQYGLSLLLKGELDAVVEVVVAKRVQK